MMIVQLGACSGKGASLSFVAGMQKTCSVLGTLGAISEPSRRQQRKIRVGKKAKQSFLTLEGFESSPYKLKQNTTTHWSYHPLAISFRIWVLNGKLNGASQHTLMPSLVRITWFEDYGAIKLMKKPSGLVDQYHIAKFKLDSGCLIPIKRSLMYLESMHYTNLWRCTVMTSCFAREGLDMALHMEKSKCPHDHVLSG